MAKKIWLAVIMSVLCPTITQADAILMGQLQKMNDSFNSLGGESREIMFRPLLMYFAGARDIYATELLERLARLNFTAESELVMRSAKCSNVDTNVVLAHAISELRTKTAKPDVTVAVWTRIYMNKQCADVLAEIEHAEHQSQ